VVQDLNKSDRGSSFRKPNPSQSRLVAFDLITQVNRGGAYANLRLPELLSQSSLDQRDRGFVTELSYGTLRMQGRHDYAISQKIDRPFSELDENVIDLLRLGVHQLLEMRVSDHAAVSETVELARKVAGESKASFINAILRAISSDSDLYKRLEEDPKIELIDKLSLLYSHPSWIVSAFYDQLRDWEEVRKLLLINNQPVAPNLVAWPGKSSVEELLETGGEKLPLSSYGVLSDHLPNEYPAIKDKRAGVQDVGSQLLSEIFLATATQERLDWLDLCAGPGGKAALLFNSLETFRPNDSFSANEPTDHRAELVARVIPRENISTNDGRDFQSFGRKFDRIMIDAPCTGLGALRRRPEARWRKSLSDLKELIPLQRELIDSAYQMLNPGGMIAYATCSPHLSETTAQVLDAKYRHKDLELVDISDFSPQRNLGLKPDGTLQLWTHLQESDSMFMAIFRKP
jgi:16S rRNA (cytosine967-C5)-methyltransferase